MSYLRYLPKYLDCSEFRHIMSLASFPHLWQVSTPETVYQSDTSD